MRRPYIGITGFMSWHEVTGMPRVLQALASQQDFPHIRDLMVGVLVSSKTLGGGTNKWPGRYPKVGTIKSIFVTHPSMVNLIHFNTDNPMTLVAELIKLHELTGSNLHGFQLNMAWPSIGDLEMYREAMGWEPRLVLQIGARAMHDLEDSPAKVSEMVGHYVGVIDDILIDPSGGKGEPFNTESARAFLRAVAERGWDIGLGVAGGLSAETLHLVGPLAEEFPQLSIDAEGRLRRKPQDDLDLEVAEKYFNGAYALFAGAKSA